jgi:hypothetical protein
MRNFARIAPPLLSNEPRETFDKSIKHCHGKSTLIKKENTTCNFLTLGAWERDFEIHFGPLIFYYLHHRLSFFHPHPWDLSPMGPPAISSLYLEFCFLRTLLELDTPSSPALKSIISFQWSPHPEVTFGVSLRLVGWNPTLFWRLFNDETDLGVKQSFNDDHTHVIMTKMCSLNI